jgi:hypothetical protein
VERDVIRQLFPPVLLKWLKYTRKAAAQNNGVTQNQTGDQGTIGSVQLALNQEKTRIVYCKDDDRRREGWCIRNKVLVISGVRNSYQMED